MAYESDKECVSFKGEINEEEWDEDMDVDDSYHCGLLLPDVFRPAHHPTI